MPQESVKIKNIKIGLRHVISWGQNFMKLGFWWLKKMQTDTQDSCFISIDLWIFSSSNKPFFIFFSRTCYSIIIPTIADSIALTIKVLMANFSPLSPSR